MRNHGGNVEFKGSFDRDVPILGLPEVAFAGRSNVGKSSLLNVLMARKKEARTSRTPGRTQRINLFDVGGSVVFVDLPGYGFARVPDAVRRAWKPMVEGYLWQRSSLRLVVVLVDVRRPAQKDDGELLYALTEARIPSLVVATKCDKLSPQKRSRALAELRRGFALPAGHPIAASAPQGAGAGEIWDAIEAACGAG